MEKGKKIIYADDLLSTLRDDKSINGANLRRVIQHINAATAVDTVVHGRWRIIDFAGAVECSVCGEEVYEESNYCPNCGAKMDGDGNE
jgi:transposase